MLKRTNVTLLIGFIAVLLAMWTMRETAIAQKASVPKQQDNVALGEDDVKQLLILMDTDNDGKVSRQEFMQFMDAEFKRLDKDGTGNLNVNELAQSRLRVSHFAAAGR
jgi:Ca2+-binding EF-hand superfamily protein